MTGYILILFSHFCKNSSTGLLPIGLPIKTLFSLPTSPMCVTCDVKINLPGPAISLIPVCQLVMGSSILSFIITKIIITFKISFSFY